MLVPSHRLSEARVMKTAVHTWISDRWAFNTSTAYWRTLPSVSRWKFLVAGFITWCAVGFVIDLLLVDYQPLGRGFFWPIYFGTLGTALFAARMRRTGLVPVLLLIMGAGLWLAVRIASHSFALPDLEAMHRRVVFDAIGTLVGTIVGYRLLVDFIRTEGFATVRIQTELALAHRIQATLVPTLSLQGDRFEVYGKSIPSAEMGGDLIDVLERDGTLLAYVADISGHGLAAGQLMGMLKTAVRVALQFREKPVAVMESADRVLPAVKEANMYATLALLYFDRSSEAEYSLAGHPPILHYRARTGNIARLGMEQLPLGLMPGGSYSSQRVSYSARDLFLMISDGISEVPNGNNEEFGLDRLEHLLRKNAGHPLPQLWELIMGEVKRHGAQEDDQTLLLLRVRT
jgi:Stage II sporulation protein E (SpoIIE)